MRLAILESRKKNFLKALRTWIDCIYLITSEDRKKVSLLNDFEEVLLKEKASWT